MTDRRLLDPLRVLVVLALLAGCGEPDVADRGPMGPVPDPSLAADEVLPEPGSIPLPVTRLLDAAPHGHHESSAEIPPRVVLLDPATDPPGTWQPFITSGRAPKPKERTAFAAHSRREPDGTLVLGPDPGGWVALLPVEPGRALLVTARVRTRGIVDHTPEGVEPSGAMLGVAELSGFPAPDALHTLPDFAGLLHWTEPLTGDRDEEVSLFVDLKGGTRHIAVVVSQPMVQSDRDARVSVHGLTVSTPDLVDVARRLSGDPELLVDTDDVPRGRFAIRHTERPCLVLPAGSSSVLPVRAPDGPAAFEAVLGLVPHSRFDPGTRLTIAWTFRPADDADAPPWLAGSREIVTRGPGAARWEPVSMPLPARAAGRDLMVEFSASVPDDSAPALAVVASPRLVPGEIPRVGPNVVLVSIDTLRSDRLGCYGYGRPTSPNLDALAARSAVFLDTWANGPYTLPSHVSLFSGQFPSVHGVQTATDRIDTSRTTTLAQILRAHGWTTGAFTGGGYVDPEFGFGLGFQRYSTLEPLANLESERVLAMLDKASGLDAAMLREADIDAVTEWIERNARQSFFLFVHTYVTHQFDPPRWALDALGHTDVPVRERDDDVQRAVTSWQSPDPDMRRRLDALYDATVFQADEAVGRILDTLDALDLRDDTVVIVTSDHGKEIGDRGLVAHGHSLYEEMLQVPLIVFVPGKQPARITTPAMLVDVLPTVLAALDLPVPDTIQGRDLFGPRQGPRPLLAEVDDITRKVALRDGAQKTIFSPLDAGLARPNTVEEESFDLLADPHERHPLPASVERTERVRAFQQGLRDLGRSLGGAAVEVDDALSPATEARLRELGYLGGG